MAFQDLGLGQTGWYRDLKKASRHFGLTLAPVGAFAAGRQGVGAALIDAVNVEVVGNDGDEHKQDGTLRTKQAIFRARGTLHAK